MPITRRFFLAASGALAIGPSLAGQRRAYTFEPDAHGHTLKDAAGRIVLGYLTSKPEGLTGNSACCVHPFNTLGGECATDIAPADHRNHRGLFFAWHDMQFTQGERTLRGDFWGWGQFAPAEGRVITNRSVRLVRADAVSAEVAVENDWTIDGEPVLLEQTTMRAGEDQGARILDLTYRFTSDYDVTLNRMAFTGMCFRCRKDGSYTFHDPGGEVTLPNSNATRPETDWPARPWYSHTVTRADGKSVASGLLDHPANPPSAWHGARGVSFLNPCITANGPVKIAAKQPLTLRYRAVAYDGKFPDGMLDKVASGFSRKDG
ncbi:MAG TPA: DUF6807 family protein [Vicinamibacterales bacterium]|nr:DUF6807 family protein [Vicinamibacterales bacterium]